MNIWIRWIFDAFVDSSNPRSLAFRLRKRRLQVVLDILQPDGHTLVVDVGSYSAFFRQGWPYPDRVIGLDVVWREEFRQRDGLTVVADVRALPFKDRSVDILCNSVMEHVGPLKEQQQAASEIVRAGRKYFVQIPHKYFPIDPHYFTIPFFHFLPMAWQRWICRFAGVGFIPRGDFLEIHYLTVSQLQMLFPKARILRERFCGLTKSLYAISQH